LEFGGGQSTLWWAARAKSVVTLEGNRLWHDKIKAGLPTNVELHHIAMKDVTASVAEVNQVLSKKPQIKYDVIVIDGLCRFEMIDVSCNFIADGGIIICDNAEGYGFYEGFKERDFNRIDFYGNAPGVVLPHSTSLYFKGSSFVFDPMIPIHVVAAEA
jgi:hypothetical protein